MLQLLIASALVLGVASAASALGSHVAGQDGFSRRTTGFWYPNMDHTGLHRGCAPDLGGNQTYQVFKSVNPGDGDAIQRAINDDNGGKRHGQWFASQPRVCRTYGSCAY